MKLSVYMITQEVNPDASILGFIWNWIEAMAHKVKELHVAAYNLHRTEELPENVHCSRFSYANLPKTWVEIISFRLSGRLDLVFAHMCPEFVLAITLPCKILRIPIVLWYSHKHVDLKLKLACLFSNKVLTGYRGGCTVAGRKLVVMGHGIYVPESRISKRNVIVSVGRISRIKEFEVAIRAMPRIVMASKSIMLKIVGDVYDKNYFEELLALARELGVENNLKFVGRVPFSRIGNIYRSAILSINTDKYGMSKTSLEAMFCGIPTLVRADVFKDILGKYFEDCHYETSEDLADKALFLISNNEKRIELGCCVEKAVKEGVGLDSLIERMAKVFEEVGIGHVKTFL